MDVNEILSSEFLTDSQIETLNMQGESGGGGKKRECSSNNDDEPPQPKKKTQYWGGARGKQQVRDEQ